MGEIIRSRTAPQLELTGILKPIIYCDEENAMADSAVPLNQILSEKLFATHSKRRTMRLSQCFEDVLKTLPDDVIIKDFDVMFNPTYKVDVLKLIGYLARYALLRPKRVSAAVRNRTGE